MTMPHRTVPSPHSYWPLVIAATIVLVATLVLANAIAFCVQKRREQRIQRKTQQLAATTTAAATALPQQRARVVPVTILTGFLGAGKTTLLNRILRAPTLPFKIMVLENELGAISIDHTLLQQQLVDDDNGNSSSAKRKALAADGIYVMQNGCMCCTAAQGSAASKSSELERILDYLLRIVDEDGFDYLIVETTGLADPGPIIETFLQLRASRFRLDAVVTLVDAYAATQCYDKPTNRLTWPIELERQVLYADIVALNKTDRVDAQQLMQLQRAVAQRNEGATVFTCVDAALDVRDIIDVHTFDAVKFRDCTSSPHSSSTSEDASGPSGGTSDDTSGLQMQAAHTSGISTVHFELLAELDIARFGEWLAGVVDLYATTGVLRIKGVVAVAGDAHRCVVQCVLDTFTIAPSTAWRTGELRASRLVIIGKHLDRGALERGFLACLVSRRSATAAATAAAVDGEDGERLSAHDVRLASKKHV